MYVYSALRSNQAKFCLVALFYMIRADKNGSCEKLLEIACLWKVLSTYFLITGEVDG